MRRIEKRIKSHYNAAFSYDEDVLLHIVARSQEVDTGARNIENILTEHCCLRWLLSVWVRWRWGGD